ncbi:DUF4167 domain-containing protein [Celeribacter sp.]|uniref:DUF4167 domain-containing protein n=1 Tax=Celeribacter sp. TaxID=1890673 RepID=UPI003A93268B
MRSTKNRSRSKNNRNRSNSVGNVVNRVFDSSGPEGRVRGTPQQIIDKYNQLAGDAQLSNDRVAAENFQQHAEHYVRLLGEAQKELDAQREQQEREREERQKRHDAERAEREERQRRHDEERAERQRKQEERQVAGEGEQPDLAFNAPASDEANDSGLVETPEQAAPKPKRARAPRKPRAPRAEKSAVEAEPKAKSKSKSADADTAKSDDTNDNPAAAE